MYENFKKEVAENIKEYLPERFQDAAVRITTVQKNNEELDGLCVITDESNISPTIYLNYFYEDYKKGRSMESILAAIAKTRLEYDKPNLDVSTMTKFDVQKKNIIAKLVGKENNLGLLKQLPYVELADMAIIFSVLLGQNFDGSIMTVPVTNEIMKSWGVTAEELLKLAKKNQKKLAPSTFISMNKVMEAMIPNIMLEMRVDYEKARRMLGIDLMPDKKMFYLSNAQKTYGASALLDEVMMEKVIEEIGEDFYILPSSIHEVIIVPAEDGMSPEFFREMVGTVNSNNVDPCDRLTNSVYRYDREKKSVYVAA